MLYKKFTNNTIFHNNNDDNNLKTQEYLMFYRRIKELLWRRIRSQNTA